jgi:hypothetical protein
LVSGGVVTIWVLPPVSHCVVRGPVFTHWGVAAATGVANTAAVTNVNAQTAVAVDLPMFIGDLLRRPEVRR